jgi:hypothetical protein
MIHVGMYSRFTFEHSSYNPPFPHVDRVDQGLPLLFTGCQPLAAGRLPLTPFDAVLTDTTSCKSFACHSYEEHRGVGVCPNVRLVFAFPALTPLFPLDASHSPVTPLFPLHTEKQGGMGVSEHLVEDASLACPEPAEREQPTKVEGSHLLTRHAGSYGTVCYSVT